MVWAAMLEPEPGFIRVTNRHALTPPNGSFSTGGSSIKISGKVGRVGSFFLRAPLLGGKSGGVVRRAPPPPAWRSCKKLIPGKKNLMADREEGWPDRQGCRVGMEERRGRKGGGEGGEAGSRGSMLLAWLPDRLGCCCAAAGRPRKKVGIGRY